jgi:hypothetical protein
VVIPVRPGNRAGGPAQAAEPAERQVAT